MKAIFYFILGALSILFISQTNKDNQSTKSIENGVSTQQLLQANGEGKTRKTASKLSNKTVENYLLKYLSNYTTNTTSTKQTSTTAKTKSNSTSTNHYSKSAKRNTYPTSKTNDTYKKPYSYSKPKSSNSTYKPIKYKKAQPTEPITYYSNSYSETVQSPTRYTGKPSGATAICRDGTYSFSHNRRGTCSRHGGVKSWL